MYHAIILKMQDDDDYHIHAVSRQCLMIYALASPSLDSGGALTEVGNRVRANWGAGGIPFAGVVTRLVNASGIFGIDTHQEEEERWVPPDRMCFVRMKKWIRGQSKGASEQIISWPFVYRMVQCP